MQRETMAATLAASYADFRSIPANALDVGGVSLRMDRFDDATGGRVDVVFPDGSAIATYTNPATLPAHLAREIRGYGRLWELV